MPSNAFDKFERYMLKDVESLLRTHQALNHTGGGRRGLGYITRSGILMLCAAWELYLEELIVESVVYITSKITLPDALPKDVKKKLADYAKTHKNELKVLELAGDGWKKCFVDQASLETSLLNTPKTDKTNKLFKEFIGLEKLSDSWSYADLDKFVELRGEIAHKGSQASYIKVSDLRTHLEIIKKTALETDNSVAVHLRDITPTRAMPWRRRNNN